MKSSPQTLWANCLKVIKDNLPHATYETWFTPIVPLTYENNIFTIQVPSQFFYEYIEDKFVDLLKFTIQKEIGPNTILNYRVLVENSTNSVVDYKTDSQRINSNKLINTKSVAVQNPFDKVIETNFDSQLNPKYSFENYFEGDSNKLARTAGLNVAQNPGTGTFNPLFLHGTSGTGKTHLCHAIGSEIKNTFPDKKVLYVTAHNFKVQYAEAGRHNTTNDFINFYQNIDVLIIDDIHELAGIEKTQNTLFHIFNHLHQNSKQLILTSDKTPAELKGVEERLLTRFRWGLTAKVSNPDRELRLKILNNIVAKDGLDIDEDVLDFVAEHVTNNVRDIEGVMVSLIAHSIVNDNVIDIALARRVIGNAIKKIEKPKISTEIIAEKVCEYYHIPAEAIQSKSRKREIVQARQIAMYLAKQLTDSSLSKIGTILGNKNHATVLHGCKTIQELIEVDKQIRDDVNALQSKLK